LTVNVLNQTPDQTSIFSIAPLDADKNEGDAGTTSFTFTVTRTNPIGNASVHWAVVFNQDPAANASDFAPRQPLSGNLSFDANHPTQIITVNVQGDSHYESGGLAENFSVVLSNPTNKTIIDPLQASAAGHIINDDDSAPVELLLPFSASAGHGHQG